MAYEKYTWVDGELITAEKLNHMEDGIAEGGGETGYECIETTEQLFSETVTIVERADGCIARLTYSEPITADELTVVFNGTQYICPKIVVDGLDDMTFYGGISETGNPDFTNYPFAINSTDNGNIIATESPMNVTVSASGTSSTVETTECFEKAVKTVVDGGYECSKTRTPLFDETVTTVQDGDDVSAQLAYSEPITADELTVVFNGTQYICPKITPDGVVNLVFYGGMSEEGDPDFTNYPFIISSTPVGNRLGTETANTYHIEVAAVETEATNISPCFASAVSQVADFSSKIKTATLSAENISVDGEQAAIMRVPSDYGSTLGVLTISPLETDDVYLSSFGCSGDRNRFYFTYKSKQASPVTLDLVNCVFTYIPTSEGR